MRSWGLHLETGWLWFRRLWSVCFSAGKAGIAFLEQPVGVRLIPHSAMSCRNELVEVSGLVGMDATKPMPTQ